MIAKIDAHHHLITRDAAHYRLLTGPGVERFYGNTEGLKREFGPAHYVGLATTQNVVKSFMWSPAFTQPLKKARTYSR